MAEINNDLLVQREVLKEEGVGGSGCILSLALCCLCELMHPKHVLD